METSAQKLHKVLLASTIGGSETGDRLGQEAVDAFTLYVKNAMSGNAEVKDLTLLRSKVSLNSIIASAKMVFDTKETAVFLKVHIEANTSGQSVLGDDKEYANAKLLETAGWPILSPLTKNIDPNYPLLVYPNIQTLSFFNLIEESYADENKITPPLLVIFNETQKNIGSATLPTLKESSTREAQNAPVQTLFLKRFKEGGRVDDWYRDETIFALPGLLEPIAWNVLKNAKWSINGTLFEKTLAEIINSARNSLAYTGEEKSFTVISHGDDHSGNMFIDEKSALLFDPAFAGENPVALSETKALAHIGYMIMGGMYFDPKLKTAAFRFDSEKNIIFAEVDFNSTPLYKEHEKIARTIIDARILPLFKEAARMGASMPKEVQRLQDALSGCPLLTINIPKLLDAKDGRGTGLLPLVIMLNQMTGLPSLEYLKDELSKLK